MKHTFCHQSFLIFSHNLPLAIRRIAKNDGNKKSLVTQGSLPVLVSLTNSEREDEQMGKHEKIYLKFIFMLL